MAQNELQYEMWRFDSAEADCYPKFDGSGTEEIFFVAI